MKADEVNGHALITGGAKRVGRALALRLAEKGYDLTVHYRSGEGEAQALRSDIMAMGRQCRLIRANLSDGQTAARLCALAQEATPMPPVTVLVHNASLFARDTLEQVTYSELDAHMRINLYAPVLLTQSFLAQLPEGAEGNVVALVDGMRGWSMSPAFLSYALSKGALEQFVSLMAPRLAPQVRINAIALGATLRGVMDKEDTFDKAKDFVPLKRNSNVEEVGDALMTLLSLPSMTGQVIRLSGGL